MLNFSTTSLLDIELKLNDILKRNDEVEFVVLNPDIVDSTYNGNHIKIDDKLSIYRSYKTWLDLAHILKCKFLTPKIVDKNYILIRYKKLKKDSFHTINTTKEEKYGNNSIFSKIYKNEEISFLHYYTEALQNVSLDKRLRILNLGINSGDEFDIIKLVSRNFSNVELVGIDYCSSAIKSAKKKFINDKNIKLYNHDINKLDELGLEKFDLIITIGTLQSSSLNFNKLFMSIIQNYLNKNGSIILGFPNCRWIDGEMVYGAMMKNYNFSEMSNLYKDVVFCKKYLQQKKFRVTITGKDYIFLTATSFK